MCKQDLTQTIEPNQVIYIIEAKRKVSQTLDIYIQMVLNGTEMVLK